MKLPGCERALQTVQVHQASEDAAMLLGTIGTLPKQGQDRSPADPPGRGELPGQVKDSGSLCCF